MTQRNTRLVILLIVLTPPVFVLCLLIPVFIGRTNHHEMNRTEVEMRGICIAVQQYESEFGVLPAGGNPAVFQLLYGTNPFHRDFFDPGDRTNRNGEFLDAWGSPYEIEINGHTNIVVKSAGPDGKWGDQDDYVLRYDGRSATLVQKP